MNFRTTLLYAGALLLGAVSPSGNASVKKFDCKYRLTPLALPANDEAPGPQPGETRTLLAERQRQTLVDAVMAKRVAPDAAILQALAQAVGNRPQ